ncbi:MAG: M23 family metallopeptidase [Clostridiales bacterium]|mgnify:CR=1 FL=1|jgi:murein DD-endopeptidase MepM/ murein hydrolase activator NlpD|nr:M23 family metallopeptidase [Clostridiales bacterium]HOA33111.1 M23 family metallopeptidase [Clostridiales bacterium]HOJ35469.1 M23 family metallopeptidase [Clostridiales bacterium]HPP68690.1 M23 family metallopeptidase [Clostridiales bacterium]HPU67306.1 M23 family metallopeptidase [Clostridiales bacterium]
MNRLKNRKLKPKNKGTDFFVRLTLVQIIVAAVIMLVFLGAFKLNKNIFGGMSGEYSRLMKEDMGEEYANSIKSAVARLAGKEPPAEEETAEADESDEVVDEKDVYRDAYETDEAGNIISEDEWVTKPGAETAPDDDEPIGGGEDMKEVDGEIVSVVFKPYTLGIKLIYPVDGYITSGFGFREHPITKEWGFHTGIDIGAMEGTEIKSAYDGTVCETGSTKGRGNYIVVDHGGGIKTLYAHCLELLKSEGDKVKKGEAIALVGSTGLSTGNHVHFEVQIDGIVRDPKYALK